MKRVLFSIGILLFPLLVSAQVYKCTENGKTIFSDLPCGKSSIVVEEAPYKKHMPKGNTRNWTPEEETKCTKNLDEIFKISRTSRYEKYVVGNLTESELKNIQKKEGSCTTVQIIMQGLSDELKKKRQELK